MTRFSNLSFTTSSNSSPCRDLHILLPLHSLLYHAGSEATSVPHPIHLPATDLVPSSQARPAVLAAHGSAARERLVSLPPSPATPTLSPCGRSLAFFHRQLCDRIRCSRRRVRSWYSSCESPAPSSGPSRLCCSWSARRCLACIYVLEACDRGDAHTFVQLWSLVATSAPTSPRPAVDSGGSQTCDPQDARAVHGCRWYPQESGLQLSAAVGSRRKRCC